MYLCFFYILSALLMKYSIILRLSSLFVNNAALNLCVDSLRYTNILFSMSRSTPKVSIIVQKCGVRCKTTAFWHYPMGLIRYSQKILLSL